VAAETAATGNPFALFAAGAFQAITGKGKGSEQQRAYQQEISQARNRNFEEAAALAEEVAKQLAQLKGGNQKSIAARKNRIFGQAATAAANIGPPEFPDIDEVPQEIDFSGPVYASTDSQNAERSQLERAYGSSRNLPARIDKPRGRAKAKAKAKPKFKGPRTPSRVGIGVFTDPIGAGNVIRDILEEKAEAEAAEAMKPTPREREINAELRKRGLLEKERKKAAEKAQVQANKRELVILKDRLQRGRELDRELRSAQKRATRAKTALRKAIAQGERLGSAKPKAASRPTVGTTPRTFRLPPLSQLLFASALGEKSKPSSVTVQAPRPASTVPGSSYSSFTQYLVAPRTATGTATDDGSCYTVCRKPRKKGQKRKKPRVCLSGAQASRLGLTAN
jgi:hypothetical protein